MSLTFPPHFPLGSSPSHLSHPPLSCSPRSLSFSPLLQLFPRLAAFFFFPSLSLSPSFPPFPKLHTVGFASLSWLLFLPGLSVPHPKFFPPQDPAAPPGPLQPSWPLCLFREREKRMGPPKAVQGAPKRAPLFASTGAAPATQHLSPARSRLTLRAPRSSRALPPHAPAAASPAGALASRGCWRTARKPAETERWASAGRDPGASFLTLRP